MRRLVTLVLLFISLSAAPMALAAPRDGAGFIGGTLSKLVRLIRLIVHPTEGEVTFPKP